MVTKIVCGPKTVIIEHVFYCYTLAEKRKDRLGGNWFRPDGRLARMIF